MELTERERVELQRQGTVRNGRADATRRARLLLLSEGFTWALIRVELNFTNILHIIRWSSCFEADGLNGLSARHAGRQWHNVTVGVEAARVLAWTTKRKPANGSSHWSLRKLAVELGGGISRTAVAHIWAKHGLKPHRLEGHIASNDPAFNARAADIIGLDLSPPPHAAVFCVDEKTAIHAFAPQGPSTAPFTGARQTTRLRLFPSRHVVLVRGVQYLDRRGARKDGQATQLGCIRSIPDGHRCEPRSPGKEIHVNADNLASQSPQRVEDFLVEHGNVHLHFTPTCSSWINQVEFWFARIECDVIACRVPAFFPNLRRRLMHYIRQYNKNAKPAKWKYFGTSRRITTNSTVAVH